LKLDVIRQTEPNDPNIRVMFSRESAATPILYAGIWDDEIMSAYVALLRAVNVGGTGKLPMGDLRALCEKAGFGNVRTYIASGNVVFDSVETEARVKATLEAALTIYAGKPVDVLVRTASELAEVLASNPFPDALPNRTVAIFLDGPPMGDALERINGKDGEEIRLGKREIYVHYGDGMANSRLKIPAAKAGTARNINTISKLVEMASGV
jgi:uncharacterized protein (DUF1697 family)